MSEFQNLLQEELKDPEFKKEWDDMQPEMDVIRAMIDARIEQNLTPVSYTHLNLIPVNPIKERNYKQPDHTATEKFKIELEKNAINVTIRREMGRDIDGACGQLRKRYTEG